jgi:predicted metal-dependent phosphoesterase TrpH
MPRGDPFTALCRQAANLSRRVTADLHLHTTASDGELTPSQVVAFARQARLDAVAITDHDTLAGVNEAIEAAEQFGGAVRVIPGVELTAEWGGREVHVLGYILTSRDCQGAADVTSAPWRSRLVELCARRRDRFRDFVRLIRESGHAIDDGMVSAVEARSVSLGRRHVAMLVVRARLAPTYREAWRRFVGPLGSRVIPKLKLPFAEAVELIRESGGVSSLAHPSSDLSESDLAAMKDAGLDAVEAKFPAAGVGRTAELITLATRLGLTVTGGSDSHGGDAGRAVGSVGLTGAELQALTGVAVR